VSTCSFFQLDYIITPIGAVIAMAEYDAKAVADIMGVGFARFGVRAGGRAAETVQIVSLDTQARKTQARLPALLQFIEMAVENGLPRSALRHVAASIAGDDKAKISALEFGVVPKTTLERRATKLTVAESERTERLARLFVQARRALGSEPEAREFMTTPHPQLDGRSPVETARTDLGTRRTERILTALEYGLAV
jgi:putative toxin-antitoxin system antitoxin component (TIGR02293 family)